jgi:NADP-dependent 3-hydroxy acid dehydrogenase YdfG
MPNESQTALITGGTSGIGRATANKLARLGVHVIVVGRNTGRGEKTVAEIRAAGGKADLISSDLRDAASAREVARKAIELGNGHVDILINNAGIYPFGPTHEMTEELFERVYSLNVKAPYFLVAELGPLMAKRGKGAMVNVSTMAADYGAPGMSLYGSSKAWPELFRKDITIGTGRDHDECYNAHLRDLIIAGRAKPSVIVSHRLPLAQAPTRLPSSIAASMVISKLSSSRPPPVVRWDRVRGSLRLRRCRLNRFWSKCACGIALRPSCPR